MMMMSSPHSCRFTVYENEPMGALVDTVDAVDIDSEAFGEVRYSIVTQQPIPP